MSRDLRTMLLPRMIVLIIGALTLAVMCANASPTSIATMHDLKILPTATIVDSPDTVGLADSNLMRINSYAEINKELDMMQSIGVKDIRIGLYWAEIEPIEGVFNWTKADYIINQANARGMGVLAGINETPAWAGDVIGAGTPSTTDFAAYATTLAQRYQGKVSAFEIWNEPNAAFFLNPVSPANYTALLKAGYTAIKAVDPSVTVIGGVLGSGQTTYNDAGKLVTMDPTDFLQGMYDAGAQGYFDALSFHPYKYDVKFSNQALIADSPLRQLKEMRALMEQYGDGAKDIWATEYGLPTVSGGAAINDIDQQKQADFIADFLNSWGEQAGTGPIFIYSTRDINTGDGNQGNNFGIWETNWTPKLAVQVIQDFIAEHTSSGNPIIDAIKNFIIKSAEIIRSVIQGLVNVAVGIAKAIAAGIVWFINAIVNVTQKVVNAIATVTAKVIDAVVNVTKKVITGIGNLIRGGITALKNLIDRIFNRTPGAAVPAAAKLKAAASTQTPAKSVQTVKTAAAVAAVDDSVVTKAGKSKKSAGNGTPVATAATGDDGTKSGTDGSGDKSTAPDPVVTDANSKAYGRKAPSGKPGKGSASKSSDDSQSVSGTDSEPTDSGKPAHSDTNKKSKNGAAASKPAAATSSGK